MARAAAAVGMRYQETSFVVPFVYRETLIVTIVVIARLIKNGAQ